MRIPVLERIFILCKVAQKEKKDALLILNAGPR